MKEIIAIQQDDQQTFEQVFAEYHQKLYFYILKKTSSSYIAEEVVQLTFIKLWVYRQNLSTKILIEPQIFRIAKTTLIDLLRKNAHQRNIIEGFNNLNLCKNETAISGLQEKETNKHVAALIDKLPPIRKKVFKLSRDMGLSHKEIAQHLSLTPKNVENHISKAIKQLRKALQITSILVIILFFLKYFF